jgi:DNA-binding CsgD family transcriptional regulator
MAMRFHQHHMQTRQIEAGEKRDPRDLIVAPCDETFRHKSSPGTKLFRRFLKERTDDVPDFSGCQSVEQWLVENELVRHDSFPGLLKPGKDFSRLESKTATASLSGAPVETGEFGPPNEAHLANDELEPWFYSLERIQELRSARENELAARIESLKRDLTPAQFEAIDLVYLRNDRGASQDEIAARIGISIGSLRDRLAGAFAKIEKKFPELRRKRRHRRRSVRL